METAPPAAWSARACYPPAAAAAPRPPPPPAVPPWPEPRGLPKARPLAPFQLNLSTFEGGRDTVSGLSDDGEGHVPMAAFEAEEEW